MNKLILLLLLLSNIAFAQDFDCAPMKEIKWESLGTGVEWAKYDLEFTPYTKEEHRWEKLKSRSVTVRALKINLKNNKLILHRSKNDLSCNPASEKYIHKMIIDHGKNVIGAINANFFIMPNGNILGLAMDEHKIWSNNLSNLTISSSGVFGIENGIPFLESRDNFISRFGEILSQDDAQHFTFAIQAYPKLVIENQLQITDSVWNVRVARTSIGTANNPDESILVTIDARGANSQTGMTLFEYAHLVKTDKCGVGQKSALNLDGGGSTSFAIPSLNIYEQGDKCRHLGNILTIQAR